MPENATAVIMNKVPDRGAEIGELSVPKSIPRSPKALKPKTR